MTHSVTLIDDLLNAFDRELPCCSHSNTNTNAQSTQAAKIDNASTNNAKTDDHTKHKNGKIPHVAPDTAGSSSTSTSTSSEPIKETNSKSETEAKYNANADEQTQQQDEEEKELDDLSEEEALRLAMQMSMTEEDHQLVALIEREIHESQRHLSNWFSGNFESVRDKNRAWCDFCRRLHHQFEMYRIEQGIIQPLQYQFFIQFIALMYGTMPRQSPKTSKKKKKKRANDSQSTTPEDAQMNIDQHKIRDIVLLSGDDDAIKYLRFKQGISREELKGAVYAKFQSLALDPTCPDEWKFNHVMFVRSAKAPNGLLWTKWHMQ